MARRTGVLQETPFYEGCHYRTVGNRGNTYIIKENYAEDGYAVIEDVISGECVETSYNNLVFSRDPINIHKAQSPNTRKVMVMMEPLSKNVPKHIWKEMVKL